MATTQGPEELWQTTISPFHAEHNRNYEEAYKLHDLAIRKLNTFVNDPNIKDALEKQTTQDVIGFHRQRMEALESVLNGTGALLTELPTTLSAAEELKSASTSGRRLISNDLKTLMAWSAHPNLRANATEQEKHLLQVPVPFYTPTLDPKLPNISYCIHKGRKGSMFANHRLLYFDIKDGSDKQTLYRLQASKATKMQTPLSSLHRVAEFAIPCITVQILPIKTKNSYGPVNMAGVESAMTGRPLRLISSFWGTIDESTDRLEKLGWTPRRFSYGGRRFVWKQEGGDDWGLETLYEVEKEWLKPGSKTGKMEEKTLGRKLFWGQYQTNNQVGTIHFAGGIDQAFQEYMLASQLTKLIIMRVH